MNSLQSSSNLERLGVGGRAKKTHEGQNSAMKQFEKFLEYAKEKHIGVGARKIHKAYNSWTKVDYANEMVFQEFAYYLAKEAVKEISTNKQAGKIIEEDADGEALAISTALQYFSNFVQFVVKLEGEVEFFDVFKHLPKGESPLWVRRIREDFRSTMEKDLMLNGIPTAIKPRGIDRTVLEPLVDALIDRGE